MQGGAVRPEHELLTAQAPMWEGSSSSILRPRRWPAARVSQVAWLPCLPCLPTGRGRQSLGRGPFPFPCTFPLSPTHSPCEVWPVPDLKGASSDDAPKGDESGRFTLRVGPPRSLRVMDVSEDGVPLGFSHIPTLMSLHTFIVRFSLSPSVKDKEDLHPDPEVQSGKDETFGDYR